MLVHKDEGRHLSQEGEQLGYKMLGGYALLVARLKKGYCVVGQNCAPKTEYNVGYLISSFNIAFPPKQMALRHAADCAAWRSSFCFQNGPFLTN